jgi:hypothetical protein
MYIIENKISKLYNDLKFNTLVPIGIIITDSIGNLIEDADRVYELRVKYVEYIPKTEKNSLRIKVLDIKNSTCFYKRLEGDVDYLPKVYENLRNLECFDLQPYNISIIGSEDKPAIKQSSIHIYLNMCNNFTDSNATKKKLLTERRNYK